MDFEKVYGEMPMSVAVYDPAADEVVYANKEARERFLFDLNKSKHIRDFVVPQYDNDFSILEHLIKTERYVNNYHLTLRDGSTISVNGNHSGGYFVFYFINVDYAPTQPGKDPTVSYSDIMGNVVQAFCTSRDTVNIVYAILKTVSLYMGADRAYIFEPVDGGIFKCTNEFLKNGVAPHTGMVQPAAFCDAGALDSFSRGISKIVNNCGEQASGYYGCEQPKDVKSYAQIPMLDGEELIGVVGFDICGGFHTWTDDDRKIFESVIPVLKEMILKRRLEETSERGARVMTTVLDNLSLYIYVIDFDTHELLFANKALRDYLGDSYKTGEPCWKILRPDMTGPCPFCRKDRLGEGNIVSHFHDLYNEYAGLWLYVTETLIEWTDGRRAVLMTSLDITERKKLEQELKYRASTDVMTSAYSRNWGLRIFKERYDAAIEQGNSITVCFADINRLKRVNDRFGHDVGDTLIQSVSSAIRQSLSPDDYFIRLGGDEFLIVFENPDRDAAQAKINEAVEFLDEVNRKSKFPFECSISYGIESTYAGDGRTIDDVINHADSKMYEQKKLYSEQNANR